MEKVKNIVIIVLLIVVIALVGWIIYLSIQNHNIQSGQINDDNDIVVNIEGINMYPIIQKIHPREYFTNEEAVKYMYWIENYPIDEEITQEEVKKFKNIPEDIEKELKKHPIVSEGPSTPEYEYIATSELKEGINVFSAENLNFYNYDKAWAEGIEGYGIGEKVTFKYMFLRSFNWFDDNGNQANTTWGIDKLCELQYKQKETSDFFDEGIKSKDECHFYLDEIYIENGYCKSKELWEKNSRVKTLKLTLTDNKNPEIYILHLQDTIKPQIFDINYKTDGISNPLNATFEILEVYKGTTYQDTVITTLDLRCNEYGIGNGY